MTYHQGAGLSSIDKSGYHSPPLAARLYHSALETVLGKSGTSALLNLAGLRTWSSADDDLEPTHDIDFAEFSTIHSALEEMYGPRAGRGLARRIGWSSFHKLLDEFGALSGVSDLAFKVLPLPAKLKLGFPAMTRVFQNLCDHHCAAQELDEAYLFSVQRCPACWGRKTESPVCYSFLGLLEESLRWVSGGQYFLVQEIECIATGDKACVFRVEKAPLD
jgi:hypothetical protein